MKLVLLKFGAVWCPPCQALAKRGTLEKFAAEHDDVKVVVHDDTENGSKRYEELADKWKIRNIPTLIWVAGDEELLRSYDVSARGIEEQYRKARAKADRA